jgi:hypothetical protein
VEQEYTACNQALEALATIHEHTPPPARALSFKPRQCERPKPERQPPLPKRVWHVLWPTAERRREREKERRRQVFFQALKNWSAARKKTLRRFELRRNMTKTGFPA